MTNPPIEQTTVPFTRAQASALGILRFAVLSRSKRDAELRGYETEFPARYYLRDVECDTQELAKGRAIFNGCTQVWLVERYGPVVEHHPGVGWYLDLTRTDPFFSVTDRS